MYIHTVKHNKTSTSQNLIQFHVSNIIDISWFFKKIFPVLNSKTLIALVSSSLRRGLFGVILHSFQSFGCFPISSVAVF